MAQLFFSYSHRDEALRDELEVHLAQLKNKGIIEAWHDRRIPAGDAFDDAISENLEGADLILLLVSPYFLASRYCYHVEMTRALERHAAGEARVIPVILHPCDWKTAPFAGLQAVPRDAVPVSKYPNQHDAFLEIATAVRQATRGCAPAAPRAAPAPASGPKKPEVRTSNLRVRKEFTDHDCDHFLDASFEYMANFFEGSLRELEQRNPEITMRFKRIDAQQFTAMIYRDGKQVSQCLIHLGTPGTFGKGIFFSHEVARGGNGFNESLTVRDDGHLLSLEPMGMASFGSANRGDRLTQEGAAEYYWSILIGPLQR
jgi:hypothetical protein